MFTLNDLNTLNPDQLTFTIKQKILKIYDMKSESRSSSLAFWNIKHIKYQSKILNYQKQYKLKAIVKKNDFNTLISSDIVNEMFCFSYDTNGNQVYLQLCGLPTNLSKVDVYCTLTIKESNSIFYDSFEKMTCNASGCLELFGFDKNGYNDIDEFTFLLDVKILNEYDLIGNIIESQVEEEWDQFINNELWEKAFKGAKQSDVGNDKNNPNVITFNSGDRKERDNPFEIFRRKYVMYQDSDSESCDPFSDFPPTRKVIESPSGMKNRKLYHQHVQTAGFDEKECEQEVNETDGHHFRPYCETNTKTDKTYYFQHFGVGGKIENKSNEELRLEDIYGYSEIENKVRKDLEGTSWWFPVYQFVCEVLNDQN